MKSKETINKHCRELRKLIESHPDEIVRRVAYESERVLLWASRDTRGWETPAQGAQSTAFLIRSEYKLLADAAKERT